MIEIHHKYITKPGQLLPLPFTVDDGIGLAVKGEKLYLHDCIIDLKDVPLDEQDEALAITWGAQARIQNCVIRNAGKLCLLGSGDASRREDEELCRVRFEHCLLKNFSRRGPEVQCGMVCSLDQCLITNWGDTDMFNVRTFGAWAHDEGAIIATNCVFMNKNSLTFKQRILDRAFHFSQAIQDNGIKALFSPMTYRAGWRRGLTASDTGRVIARHCYASDGVILLGQEGEQMNYDEARALYFDLIRMEEQLITDIPTPQGEKK